MDQNETLARDEAAMPLIEVGREVGREAGIEGSPVTKAKHGWARRLGLIGVGAGLLVLMLAWVGFLGWALFQLRHLV